MRPSSEMVDSAALCITNVEGSPGHGRIVTRGLWGKKGWLTAGGGGLVGAGRGGGADHVGGCWSVLRRRPLEALLPLPDPDLISHTTHSMCIRF